MVRRGVGIVGILALYLSCASTSANASPAASQATDPNANTPAGVIYAIPLDSARADAAPRPHTHSGGSGLGGSGGATPGSGLGGGGSTPSGGSTANQAGGGTPHAQGKSAGESTVGATSAAPSSAAGTKDSEPILVPGGTPGSLVHSANGFGSSSQVPGYNAPTSQGLGALQSGSGSGPLLAIVLSVLALMVGGFFGAQAWHLHHRGASGAGDYSEA